MEENIRIFFCMLFNYACFKTEEFTTPFRLWFARWSVLNQESYWCSSLRHDKRNLFWIHKVWQGNHAQLRPLDVWWVYLVKGTAAHFTFSLFMAFLSQRPAYANASPPWQECTTAWSIKFIKLLIDLSLHIYIFFTTSIAA